MDADLLARYYPVALFAVFCLLFAVGTFFATRIIRKDNPGPLKDLTYECGEVPEGEAMIQFHFQYYVFAIIFVVFDVAAVFLLLWALSSGATWGSSVAFASIVLFVAIMFIATNYALKKEEVLYI